MKREAAPSKPVSSSSSRRHKYTKVLDNRKHAVRGLWRRNGSYVARITVEDDIGKKTMKWIPLATATSDAEGPLFELHILESNLSSPGTWAVPEPTCVAKLTAECGITFDNGNKTFAIAVKRDYVCLTLDGSGSIDPDGDPLQINWVIDETNIVADTVVTNCLDLGCHTITMMASDGQTRCHQFLDVCVITPAQAVQQCIDLVEQTQLAHKNKRPLIATLKAAQAAFDRDGWKVGALMLTVFQNKVRTQIARSNPTEAAMFIECAENVLKAIECVVNDATSSTAGSRR
jgi:hypothetical protein